MEDSLDVLVLLGIISNTSCSGFHLRSSQKSLEPILPRDYHGGAQIEAYRHSVA